MRLIVQGPNQTVVMLRGESILFSYETPVAAYIGGVYYVTDKKHSNTTTRHINRWVDGEKCIHKPQEFFNDLVGEI